MGDHELVQFIEHLVTDGFRELFAQHIFITFLATVPAGIITEVCTAIGRPQDILRLIAGLGDVESAAPSLAMWTLGRQVAASETLTTAFEEGLDGLDARLRDLEDDDGRAFAAAFDDFLVAFGARGPNEWESSCPTWETEPVLALAAIDRMRLSPDDAGPATRHSGLVADRERLSAEITDLLTGDPETKVPGKKTMLAALQWAFQNEEDVSIELLECYADHALLLLEQNKTLNELHKRHDNLVRVETTSMRTQLTSKCIPCYLSVSFLMP